MPVAATNPFKQKLRRNQPQFGLFAMSLTAQTADALARRWVRPPQRD